MAGEIFDVTAAGTTATTIRLLIVVCGSTMCSAVATTILLLLLDVCCLHRCSISLQLHLYEAVVEHLLLLQLVLHLLLLVQLVKSVAADDELNLVLDGVIPIVQAVPGTKRTNVFVTVAE